MTERRFSSLPARRTRLGRGGAELRRAGMKRAAAPKKHEPSSPGEAFDAWVRRVVKKRDPNACRRCGVSGEVKRLDCAHLERLGSGASRRDPLDVRNYPSLRILLCAPDGCHRELDELHTWKPEDIGLDMKALWKAARDEAWKHNERWQGPTTRAKPTPRRRVA